MNGLYMIIAVTCFTSDAFALTCKQGECTFFCEDMKTCTATDVNGCQKNTTTILGFDVIHYSCADTPCMPLITNLSSFQDILFTRDCCYTDKCNTESLSSAIINPEIDECYSIICDSGKECINEMITNKDVRLCTKPQNGACESVALFNPGSAIHISSCKEDERDCDDQAFFNKSSSEGYVTQCCLDDLCNNGLIQKFPEVNYCYMLTCIGDGCVEDAISAGVFLYCPQRQNFGCEAHMFDGVYYMDCASEKCERTDPGCCRGDLCNNRADLAVPITAASGMTTSPWETWSSTNKWWGEYTGDDMSPASPSLNTNEWDENTEWSEITDLEMTNTPPAMSSTERNPEGVECYDVFCESDSKCVNDVITKGEAPLCTMPTKGSCESLLTFGGSSNNIQMSQCLENKRECQDEAFYNSTARAGYIMQCCDDDLCNDGTVQKFSDVSCYELVCTGEGCVEDAINAGVFLYCPQIDYAGCEAQIYDGVYYMGCAWENCNRTELGCCWGDMCNSRSDLAVTVTDFQTTPEHTSTVRRNWGTSVMNEQTTSTNDWWHTEWWGSTSENDVTDERVGKDASTASLHTDIDSWRTRRERNTASVTMDTYSVTKLPGYTEWGTYADVITDASTASLAVDTSPSRTWEDTNTASSIVDTFTLTERPEYISIVSRATDTATDTASASIITDTSAASVVKDTSTAGMTTDTATATVMKDTSTISITTDTSTDGKVIDTSTATVMKDTSTDGKVIDTSTATVMKDTSTDGKVIDTSTATVMKDTSTDGKVIDTSTATVMKDTSTDGITTDTYTAGVVTDTTTEAVVRDITTANVMTDTPASDAPLTVKSSKGRTSHETTETIKQSTNKGFTGTTKKKDKESSGAPGLRYSLFVLAMVLFLT